MASVKAIEDAYKNECRDFYLPTKASLVRYITLLSEMIQNHIRWFYAYFMSEIPKLDKNMVYYLPFDGEKWRRGIAISNYPIKIIALFGGQWPHNSYAVPGGITSDFTYYELNAAKSFCELPHLTEGVAYCFIEAFRFFTGFKSGCSIPTTYIIIIQSWYFVNMFCNSSPPYRRWRLLAVIVLKSF